MIDLATRPTRTERVLAQRNADSMILLSPSTGHYYTLDEVGTRVWELCDGSRQVANMVETLYAEYDAPLDMIQGDVVELLNDLEREQLLTIA